MTANVGLQYLAERGYQDDGLGVTAFIKAHYDWSCRSRTSTSASASAKD